MEKRQHLGSFTIIDPMRFFPYPDTLKAMELINHDNKQKTGELV